MVISRAAEICKSMNLHSEEEFQGHAMVLYRLKALEVDNKTTYLVPDHLEFIKKVGSGAYGTVASFRDPISGEKIAVKKVQHAFDDLIDAKRILREIRILTQLSHENIIRIIELYPPSGVDFEDIYIVTDLMETDLHRVIYSKQPLTDEHAQYFTYQILRGLKYLHSANVIHRDLKPSNILVNKNCDLKICDFGLARGFNSTDAGEAGQLTDYVVTRWYRAPEVVLSASAYTRAIDVWSVGCILCEIVGRKSLFMGKDHLDQIRRIVEVLGTPPESELDWLPIDGPARKFLGKIPHCQGRNLAEVLANSSGQVNPVAVDVAYRMMAFNPHKRIGVSEALTHQYFTGLHNDKEEPVASASIDWSFDNFEPTKKNIQDYIYVECAKFHPEIVERDARDIERTSQTTVSTQASSSASSASLSTLLAAQGIKVKHRMASNLSNATASHMASTATHLASGASHLGGPQVAPRVSNYQTPPQ